MPKLPKTIIEKVGVKWEVYYTDTCHIVAFDTKEEAKEYLTTTTKNDKQI